MFRFLLNFSLFGILVFQLNCYAQSFNLISEEDKQFNNLKEFEFANEKFILAITYCSHPAKFEDSVLRLIRRFGYRSPYNIHLENFYDTNISEFIKVPLVVLYFKNDPPKIEFSCEDLKRTDLNFYILRGKEAQLKIEDNKILFFPGFTRREFDRYELANDFPEYKFIEINKNSKSPILFEKLNKEKIVKVEPELKNEVEKPLKNDEIKDESAKNVFKQDDSLEFKWPQGKKQFSFSTNFESITDKNNPVIIVSEIQPSLAFNWDQMWTENFYSYVGFTYSWHKYNDDNVDLTNTDLNVGSLFFGFKYFYSQESLLNVSLGTEEKVTYKQVSEDYFSIQKELVPFVGVSLEQKLGAIKKLNSFLVFGYEQFLQGDNYVSGNTFSGGLKVKYDLDNKNSLTSNIIYGYGEHKTDFVEFNMKELSIGIEWGVGF